MVYRAKKGSLWIVPLGCHTGQKYIYLKLVETQLSIFDRTLS